MEKEQISSGQPELSAGLPVEEVMVDLEATHEVAQRGQSVLELSKELTSSSKTLLEQLDPIV